MIAQRCKVRCPGLCGGRQPRHPPPDGGIQRPAESRHLPGDVGEKRRLQALTATNSTFGFGDSRQQRARQQLAFLEASRRAAKRLRRIGRSSRRQEQVAEAVVEITDPREVSRAGETLQSPGKFLARLVGTSGPKERGREAVDRAHVVAPETFPFEYRQRRPIRGSRFIKAGKIREGHPLGDRRSRRDTREPASFEIQPRAVSQNQGLGGPSNEKAALGFRELDHRQARLLAGVREDTKGRPQVRFRRRIFARPEMGLAGEHVRLGLDPSPRQPAIGAGRTRRTHLQYGTSKVEDAHGILRNLETRLLKCVEEPETIGRRRPVEAFQHLQWRSWPSERGEELLPSGPARSGCLDETGTIHSGRSPGLPPGHAPPKSVVRGEIGDLEIPSEVPGRGKGSKVVIELSELLQRVRADRAVRKMGLHRGRSRRWKSRLRVAEELDLVDVPPHARHSRSFLRQRLNVFDALEYASDNRRATSRRSSPSM